MNAKELNWNDFLKETSPDDNFGIRADLAQARSYKHLEEIVHRFAKAYHTAKVESVVDEMIWKKYPYYHNEDKYEGAKWLKDELLKK